MANVLYPSAKQGILRGEIIFHTDDIRVILVDLADYTFNSAHDFLDDVPAAARVAVSTSLLSKTTVNGVADAADITFTAVTGDPSEALILYKHTGVESTSSLIAYIDTATGLPVTPGGGNIPITWNASGIFAIG